MASSLFITGTDTGIGKTVLTASLLVAARAGGLSAAPMKPIQTGSVWDGARLRAPDLDFCLRASGMRIDDSVYEQMAPYCFEPACSPHLAAEKAGRRIELQVIRSAYRGLAAEYTCVLAEGAGGVMAPINATGTMLDVMRSLGVRVLLAARPGLGTLNHTLLSLQALRHASVEVAGVVLVESAEAAWGDIEADNRRMIEKRGGVSVLGVLPFAGGLEGASTLPAALVSAGEGILNRL